MPSVRDPLVTRSEVVGRRKRKDLVEEDRRLYIADERRWIKRSKERNVEKKKERQRERQKATCAERGSSRPRLGGWFLVMQKEEGKEKGMQRERKVRWRRFWGGWKSRRGGRKGKKVKGTKAQ